MTDDLKDAVERVKAMLDRPAFALGETPAYFRDGRTDWRLFAEDLRALLALLSTREVIDLSSGQSTRGSTGAGGEAVPCWAELIAAEFAKPQFMTTTSGPGKWGGTQRYSLEFTFVGDVGPAADAARAARDSLEDAFLAAGRAINGAAQ